MNLRGLCFRISRILVGKKGIYCKKGKKNHFSEGVIAYEQATLGKYNYISPYSIINNAIIGNYCSIGPGCRIGLGEHDMTAISLRPTVANGFGNMELFDIDNPTIIGNDVWIGTNVIVKQGVKIGNGAVIGANALVLNDVPEYAITYGSPARCVRMRFPENIISQIENSKWYEYDLDKAREKVKEISGVIST